jgi:hypothetical protein
MSVASPRIIASSLLFGLAFLVYVDQGGAASTDEHVTRRDFLISIGAGVAVPFFDVGQFKDDLQAAELNEFETPVAVRVRLGGELKCMPRHSLDTFWEGRYDALERDAGHRSAQLEVLTGTLHVGYGFRAVSWLSLEADAGIGIGGWEFEMIGAESAEGAPLDGLARGSFVPVSVEGRVRFHLPANWGIGLFGGYLVDAGDFDRRSFGDRGGRWGNRIDLGHPLVGIEFSVSFNILKRQNP